MIEMSQRESTDRHRDAHGIYEMDSTYSPSIRPHEPLTTQQVTSAKDNLLRYSKAILGLAAAFSLLLPISLLPGLIVVILPVEIALLGRVYDVVIENGPTKSTLPQSLSIDRNPVEVQKEDTVVRPSGQNPFSQ